MRLAVVLVLVLVSVAKAQPRATLPLEISPAQPTSDAPVTVLTVHRDGHLMLGDAALPFDADASRRMARLGSVLRTNASIHASSRIALEIDDDVPYRDLALVLTCSGARECIR